ncbi:MAG: transposase [Thermoflexales bacterium]
MGRPSLPPGLYFRALMVGYFEGLDSERGIAWRVADSPAIRDILGLSLDERTPDHPTLSKTRRVIGLETYHAVSTWVLEFGNSARRVGIAYAVIRRSRARPGWGRNCEEDRRARRADNVGATLSRIG